MDTPRYFCRKCGEKWVTLTDTKPEICPHCKSSSFNWGHVTEEARARCALRVIHLKKLMAWST